MSHKKLNRAVAAGVFLISLTVYVSTISPTVTLWDVGEFCAAAFSLQVPHPPGAPLFLLLARLASIIPATSDIAMRMHLLSALASALTCTLLYLLSVRFMISWRGTPEVFTDKIFVHGSAVLGSFSLAFSPTFWSSAIEAEVYGMGMLFVSLILWLGMCWYEQPDHKNGDSYFLLVAYLVGLAAGVHYLAILTLFPVMLLYYFKFHEFSPGSFVRFGAAALIVFAIVYPGIVKTLPSMLDGEFAGIRSVLFQIIPILLIGAAIYGVYVSARKQARLLNFALLSFLFVALGFSTYTVVFIRANASPPMNENNPSTLAKLVSYLGREQYGDEPMMDRRWNNDPAHRPALAKYSGD
ncbi:MAG TPA: DUF2723 domain-containing protein, partial [Bacteroidota bacterium]|nr:DUF2723 domain-containing protein [Bacteroidota bacterium]